MPIRETELKDLEDELFFDIEEDEDDRGDDLLEEEDEEEDEEDQEDEEDSEDDDEQESTDDEDDEEEEGEEEPSDSDKRIEELLKRFDEERGRSAWLESQLEKLIASPDNREIQEEEEEPEPFDYDAAEDKYAEYLLEGESAKASKVRNLINRSRQEDVETLIKKATSKVTLEAQTSSSQAVEESKFSDLVESFETKHPSLDIDSPDYDEETTNMVNTLLAGFMSQGKTKSQSLKLAVSKVIKEVPPKKESLGNKRDTQSRKKKASASQSQPPKNKGVSTKDRDMESLDISKMSERDYNKLTAKEKKILRGD